MFGYDRTDYEEDRREFILEAQQKVWDKFIAYLRDDGLMTEDEALTEASLIVEDWTGHPFQLDIKIPPQ